GAVVAPDTDAGRVPDLVVHDHPHRHLRDRDAALGRPADLVVDDVGHRGMRRYAVHPAGYRAAFDERPSHVHGVGDVDSLSELVPEHVDAAIPDDYPGEAHVDPVEPRAGDGDAVENGSVDVLDRDPVVAPDDGDVLDGHPARPDDDSAAYDRARVADEHLAPCDHDGPLVHARREMHDRRPKCVRGRARAC